MIKARCDQCRFWTLRSYEQPHLSDDAIGVCRRHAPRPTMGVFEFELLRHLTFLSWNECTEEERKTEFEQYEEATSAMCEWPATTGVDWCGDFAEITESP